MNNKKGFTLIELIAVIIVLSIIALISTPIVTGIMESSRKKAYDNIVTNIEDSAYKYSIYNNLGYSELYKPLQLSEIQNSGYLESKDIIDPRNNEKMDGCVAYKWDVSKNQYHFVYQEECDPQSLFPKVEISIPNISDIDNTEWLQEKIQLEVKDAYRSYKYCVSKEKKCTPDKDYKGKTTIQETGRNIYICVTGFMGEDEGLTACVGPYNVDPDKPVLALKEVKTLSSRITVTATCTDDISQVKSLQYSINDGAYQNSNVFKNLKSGKYNVKVRCIDNALHEVTANKEVTLDVIPVPEIIQISQKPADTKTYPKYATERVIRITYYNENVQSPKYYYSTDGENWTQLTSGTTKDLTFTSNGKVYAKTTDEAGNVASASTYSVVNMDTTAPSASLALGTMYTDRTTLTATCNDAESGIVKYEFSKDNGSTWTSNGTNKTYTFTGLKQDTNYTFAVRCTNGSALTKTATADGKPVEITKATIKQISEKPGNMPYATERVFRITYSGTNVVSPKYYYSTDGTNWTEVTSGTTKDITFTANGKLYAKTVDPAGNTASATTFVVTNIDTTAPSASISIGNVKTDRATITATCSDAESGITKYEYSKDNGTTWIANGTTASYTFTGLTQNTSYTFAVRCTNGSGITKSATTSGKPPVVPAPTIAQTSQTPSGTTYAQSRVIRITYYNTNVTSPKYYYSTDGTNWTQLTSGTTKDLTFTAAGKVYAKTTDASGNTASATTFVVNNMDTTAPTTPTITYNGGANSCSWKNNYKITLASTDNVAVTSYQIDYDNNGTVDATTAATYVPANGTHYHYVRFRAVDNAGNASAWTATQHIHMDTAAPGIPTVTFNGGANSCSWKNNYNMTFSAIDNVGVAKFQFDHNQDGTVDREYTASSNGYNFIPESGYSTCTDRYRSVDHAGNVSAWTAVHHIHQDTTVPTVTVSVSGKVATFTIKDNISAVGYGVNQSSTTQPTYTTFTGTTSTTKTWTASAAGTYYVWVKDQAGNVNKASFTIAASAFSYAATDASYTATAACNSGGTPQNNNSCYYSSNSTVCGSSPYNCNCTKVECNCTDQCVGGNESYTYTGTCNGSDSFTAPASQGCSIANVCAGKSNCKCSCSGGDGSTVNCTTTWTYSCQKTGTRWNDCLTTNRVCGQCDSCQTCYSANSCSKTDSNYLYYTCPNGGTVSGTKCIKYTCPNGGTLSGTTCVF